MSLHHPDHSSYRHFTRRQRFDRSVQTLTGIVAGISIDGRLNAAEVAELLNWCREYSDLLGRSPFNELKAKLDEALADGVIDPEEQEDLLWVCQNLSPDSPFYDEITQDVQRLHGLMHGIMADGEINVDEARGLQDWVDEHSHLKGMYPYDELDSLLTAALKDGRIDEQEQETLKEFFDDFVEYSFAKRAGDEASRVRTGLTRERKIAGICAVCPDVSFDGNVFTFTGSSMKGPRRKLVEQVAKLGGRFSENVTRETQYLVVGAGGNPCWAFSCYGRKVEKAMEQRKVGVPIVIVHESDFWDAVTDAE
jgi:hypothetical protein